MGIYESFLVLLEQGIEKYGNSRKLAEALGVHANLITRWRNKERVPNLTSIQPLIDLLNTKILFSSANNVKEVCFANAHVLPPFDNGEKPKAEDYIAVPMFGEVGAGLGYMPEDSVSGWFMVHVDLPAVRHRRNLIAVEIAKGSTSMLPTLSPGDIVLVDRDNKDVSTSGHIMLVLDPTDGSGMIKRVSVHPKDEDFIITFYSDNASEWPPQVYSFNNDFDHEWDKVVAGRVIWAWSDMREK